MGLSVEDIHRTTEQTTQPLPNILQGTQSNSGGGAWQTGDYKISAQTATHDDPSGGKWLLCDGSAIDATYSNLIALVGANTPDAQGRGLWMKGTNAAVDVIGDNDGVATVANRRPQHRHTPHSHTVVAQTFVAGPSTVLQLNTNVSTQNYATSSVDGGSGNANDSLDAPTFVVPGNLFVHS